MAPSERRDPATVWRRRREGESSSTTHGTGRCRRSGRLNGRLNGRASLPPKSSGEALGECIGAYGDSRRAHLERPVEPPRHDRPLRQRPPPGLENLAVGKRGETIDVWQESLIEGGDGLGQLLSDGVDRL